MSDPILLVTPSPKPDESQRGYSLRLTQANGLPTTWHLLQISGIPESQARLAILPLDALSRLTGKSEEELRYLDYATTSHGTRRIFGQDIPSSHTRFGHARLCPECIRENGYIPTWWDLELAVACPIHNREFIDHCPACHENISWQRGRLDKCKCGYSFYDSIPKPASSEVAIMMRLLFSVIHGMPAPGECEGFPAKEISGMSARSFLLTSRSLGRWRLLADSRKNEWSSPIALVSAASRVWGNWPTGLHSLLRDMQAKGLASPRMGFRARYENIWGSLFKRDLPEHEVRFLRQAFCRYGRLMSDDSHVDRRLSKPSSSDEFVSMSEFSRLTGISPRHVAHHIDSGLLETKEITGHRRRLRLVRMIDGVRLEPKFTPIDIRSAAARIGIPVSALMDLWEMGVYDQAPVPRKRVTFTCQGVDLFIGRIFRCCKKIPRHGIFKDDLISLGELMRKNISKNRGKAEIIAAILDGRVTAYGPASSVGMIRVVRET